MEFTTRGGDKGVPQPANSAQVHGGSKSKAGWASRTIRIELFILLLGCALILVSVALYAAFSSNTDNEYKDYVNTSKYQAVFLNGGTTSGSVLYSTYFGHLTKINNSYYVLQDIYYLTSTDTSNGQAASPQLTKLGCQQLHSPYDQMIINRNQVAFWENLKDDGKVVQAIKQFQQQNPNGPNCSTTSSSTNSTTGAQNSAGTTGSAGTQNSTSAQNGTTH